MLKFKRLSPRSIKKIRKGRFLGHLEDDKK